MFSSLRSVPRFSTDPMTSTPAIPIRDPEQIEANPQPLKTRIIRVIWNFTAFFLYRYTPRPAHLFRVALLRLFGGNIDWTAHPYPKCKIWLPSNLTMGPHSCLSDDVDCYNVAPITLGELVVVSQYTFLCAAGRDITDLNFRSFKLPIHIGANAWIAAKCFIGPGVSIGEGAVVGAGSIATTTIPPWTICAGNPCRVLGERKLQSACQ